MTVGDLRLRLEALATQLQGQPQDRPAAIVIPGHEDKTELKISHYIDKGTNTFVLVLRPQ